MRYYAIVVRGLEEIALSELREKLRGVHLIEKSKGMISFTYSGPPRELIKLRSIENIFIFLKIIKGMSRSRNSLGKIYKVIKGIDLGEALFIKRQLHPKRRRRKPTFRITPNMVGRHNFRRVDIQIAAENALEDRYRWKVDPSDPDLEIRIDLEGEEALVGLRLSDKIIRRRRYKVEHIPASLKPTVAYCMVRLSDPAGGDVFLDPMCGAGTILIERAKAAPYERIIGGDIDRGVLAIAEENIIASGEDIELRRWDAIALPLDDVSIDKLVCNLPFGKQIGSPQDNRKLYTGFFAEMERILKPEAKVVLLTSEKGLVDRLISKSGILRRLRKFPIELLGLRPYIYVLEKS